MAETTHRAERGEPVQLRLPLVPKAEGKLLPFPDRRPVVDDWILREFLEERGEQP